MAEGTATAPSPTSLKDWAGIAFGPVQSEEEQEEKLLLLNLFLKDSNKPPFQPHSGGEKWCLTESDIGTEVALSGRLRRKRTLPGKSRKKRRKTAITFDLVPCSSTSRALEVVVVESGIGKENFKNVAACFKNYDDDDDYEQSVFVVGIVQCEEEKRFLCVNTQSHALLIGVKSSEYPVFHDMHGAVVDFPYTFTEEGSCRQLLGSFSHAWFYSMSTCKLSRDDEYKLSQHVSAYRSSGGGIIYIGAKLVEKLKVESKAIKATIQQLTELKQQIEKICNDQRPVCHHKDWNGRQPPDMIKQQLDWCYTTSFRTNSQTHYIIRIIVCPSRHHLHLSNESDIELRERCGRTSKPYRIEDFIQRMSDIEEELIKLSSASSDSHCTTVTLPVVNSKELNLWDKSAPEDSYTENKEGNMKMADDPIKYVKEKVEDYGATWLNSHDGSQPGGALCIGVCDKPEPLTTGIWLDKSTTNSLVKSLAERFKGSLEPKNFCFPSAKNCIKVIKYQVTAYQKALLSKSSEILVIWLTKQSSHKEEFNKAWLFQQVYSLWAEQKCKTLAGVLNASPLHSPLVVPLNSSLFRCSESETEEPDALPIALSPSPELNDEQREKMVEDLLCVLQNKTSQQLNPFVFMYHFAKVQKDVNLLDSNYCVLEIRVTPSEKLFHLLKLPKFWKLTSRELSDNEHIGGVPDKMDIHEIVLRCKDSSRAKLYLSNFFQPNDRPILITDVSSHDISDIEGLTRIKWSLVVDFDFGDKQSTLQQIFREARASRPYRITNLALNKSDQVDLEVMSDPSPVYWVKALGPPTDPIKDPTSWVLSLAYKLEDYITEACTNLNKGKVLVVWSKRQSSSIFVPHVMSRLCLAAQRARAETAVVSPSSDILAQFISHKLPGIPVEEVFLELKDLSDFILSSVYPSDTEMSNDIGTKHRSIPGKPSSLLPELTVQSMRDNNLDYLYPDIENDLPSTRYDLGLAFFEGREKFARWEDFMAGNVVHRQETKFLKKKTKIILKKQNRQKNVIYFTHYPGAGGSTIARHVLWLLKDEFCCVVPFQVYGNLKNDIQELLNASDDRAVLILWDINLGLPMDFDNFKSRLKGLNVVFLRVERSYEKQSCVDLHLDQYLEPKMVKTFCTQLTSKTIFGESKFALGNLTKIAERKNEKTPLFLIMVTALEKKFIRLQDYVEHRLKDLPESLHPILLQVAFAHLHTGKPLQVRAVAAKEEWENSLPSSVYPGLMTIGGFNIRYAHMRHSLIDELVISKLIKFKKNESGWWKWTASFVGDFLKHIQVASPREFECFVRRLFHEKPDSSNVPDFLLHMGTLLGKKEVIECMNVVFNLLPPSSRTTDRAHFLGAMARAHLHVSKANDLDAALKAIKRAHGLLPEDRTLHHQEGQLNYDSIKLKKELLHYAKEPLQLAMDVLTKAKRASECFARSRNLDMQNRTSESYPYVTDVQCHIECMKEICDLMNTTLHTLPPPLCTDEYVQNFEEDTLRLLEGFLRIKEPRFFSTWRKKLNDLLGTSEDFRKEVDQLWSKIKQKTSTDLQTNAVALKKISRNLRYHLYGSAREVPVDESTKLTLEIEKIIMLPRFVEMEHAYVGHEDRFFELELLWDWSRYSKVPINKSKMLDLVNKYLQYAEKPLLRAKCYLYQGVLLLLQRLCEENRKVDPQDIVKAISECCKINSSEGLEWYYIEFVANGNSNGNYLLSSKDWYWHGSLNQSINDTKSLDSEGLHFCEFSGFVISAGDVSHDGIKFSFKQNKAPPSWQVNSEVKFYIAISSREGLQAIPISPLQTDEHQTLSLPYQWKLGKQETGRVDSIDKRLELIYFAPPDRKQVIRYSVRCPIDAEGLVDPVKEGDLYNFIVTKRKYNESVIFETSKVTLHTLV